MAALWRDLLAKEESGTLDSDERALLGKLQKTFPLLAANPKHPGLNSHEISDLSARLGQKVWQSYLERRAACTGSMGRIAV